jgi:hypothetical protein
VIRRYNTWVELIAWRVWSSPYQIPVDYRDDSVRLTTSDRPTIETLTKGQLCHTVLFIKSLGTSPVARVLAHLRKHLPSCRHRSCGSAPATMYLPLPLKLTCFSLLSVPVFGQRGRTSSSDGSRAAQSRVIDLTRPSPTGGQGPLQSGNWISPEYKWFFEYPLPRIPVKSKKQ